VKNIARPVRVFALARSRSLDRTAPAKALQLPDRPSIAVLPFTNMSGDPEQEYFADGIVEDIITALSRVKLFFVIARNSSFTYKGRAVDVRQVGRELGVRYVLEGSIRKAGSRVRITGQLIEAATGHHVWADKFDGSLEDIFDLQDQITENIVGAIEPSLRTVEMERARSKPTESLDAYDLYLRALAEMHTFTAQGYQRARELLQAAVERDPAFAEAWASLADCLGRSSLYGWIADVDEGRRLSVEAARRAVEADPNNGPVLALAAWTLAVMDGRVEQGAEYATRALSLSPNSAAVLTQCSWAFVFNGESEKTITCFNKARRLDPFDPRRTTAMTAVALAHFFAKRFDECIQIAQRVVEENPTNMSAWRFLAAAHAQRGDWDAAKRAVADVLARQPSSTVSRTAKTSRFRYGWMMDLYLDSLRLARLPE
jgi:adenylate cyclase